MLGSLCIAGAASAESRGRILDDLNQHASTMPLGSSVAPPARFIEFCARMPEQCGVSSARSRAQTEQELYSRHFWRAAFANGRVSAEPASARSRFRGEAEETVKDVSVQTVAETFETQAEPSTIYGANPKVSIVSLPLLQQINSEVNRSIRDRSDARLYGVGDYWAIPTSGKARSGDCEDHVLAKRAELLKAGVPLEAMSIALAVTRWGEAHAVLLVATDRGELVLDSLTSKIRPWDKIDYRWLERQAPGKTFEWVALS